MTERHSSSSHLPHAPVMLHEMLAALNPQRAEQIVDGTFGAGGYTRAVLEKAGVDLSRPVITTCGSGVTAAIINLALERIGKTDHALYDGSWAEWGAFGTVPVATGD